MNIKGYHHDASLDEFAGMEDLELLEYVYKTHKRTGASVRDIFTSIYEHLGKMVVNDIVRNRDSSWNNVRNLPGSSVLSEIATASFIAFILLNVALSILVPNEIFSWTAFAAYTLTSSIITWLFVNTVGKRERRYFDAVHKVQQAQIRAESSGFRDLSGKALSFVEEESLPNVRR